MTKPSERAFRTWRKIEKDLRDRRGVKHGFEGIDAITMRELRKTQASIIQAALDAEAAPKQRVYKDNKKAARHYAESCDNDSGGFLSHQLVAIREKAFLAGLAHGEEQ